jgi:hypothetical protein
MIVEQKPLKHIREAGGDEIVQVDSDMISSTAAWSDSDDCRLQTEEPKDQLCYVPVMLHPRSVNGYV